MSVPSSLCVVLLSWLALTLPSIASDTDGEAFSHDPPHQYSIRPGVGSVVSGTHGTPSRDKRSLSDSRRSPYTGTEKQALLNIHNTLRGQTKATDMLMMVWDTDLEREAQRWADRCDFKHPTQRRKVGRFDSLGQNLYVSTHEPQASTTPVQLWYDEIVDYTYSVNIQCRPGKVCGHYTQIVWAKSQALGCAIKYCEHLTSVSSFNKGYLVVCEYGPAGNIIGRYPYQRGDESCSKCPDETKYCVKNLCSKDPQTGSRTSTTTTSTKRQNIEGEETTPHPNPGNHPTTSGQLVINHGSTPGPRVGDHNMDPTTTTKGPRFVGQHSGGHGASRDVDPSTQVINMPLVAIALLMTLVAAPQEYDIGLLWR